MLSVIYRIILFVGLAAALPAQADEPVVLIVGDSLSAAYGIEPAQGWVALLGQRLAGEGFPHRVVNSSISGDTTRSGLTRLPRALRVHRPSIVVIELGGNDGLRGYPIEQMQANLAGMIEAAQAAGAAVMLVGVSIPPNYGPDFRRRFQQVFTDLAERYRVPLTSFAIEEVAVQPGMLQADGIHPTAAAQPMMLDRVWEHLHPLL